MGNAIACGSKGTGILRQARVLLPDGEIVMLELPLEAADLMMEHLNHMVVHCSKPEGGPIGMRPTMRILQAHEKLHPGQSYVVHPIPTQSTKSKFRPQALSVPPRDNSKTDSTQEQTDPRKKSAKRSSMQRFQNRVADSASGQESAANFAETPELNTQAQQSLADDASFARERRHDQVQHEDEDEDGDIVLNLNMYMGWRPALESIPESPLGYSPAMLDNMQTPPVLCV